MRNTKIVNLFGLLIIAITQLQADGLYLCDESGESKQSVIDEIRNANNPELTEDAIVEIAKKIKFSMTAQDEGDRTKACYIAIPVGTGTLLQQMSNYGQIAPQVSINVSNLQGGKTGIIRTATISSPYIAINIALFIAGCNGGEASQNPVEDAVLKNIALRAWLMTTFKTGTAVIADHCEIDQWGTSGSFINVSARLTRSLVGSKTKGTFEMLEIFGATDQVNTYKKLLQRPSVRQIVQRIYERVNSEGQMQ